jgi:hypothetical protein
MQDIFHSVVARAAEKQKAEVIGTGGAINRKLLAELRNTTPYMR